ncbi:MAG: LysE family transporter [Clostridia bacterium]|nr:LysE family transporter [Clostridia bacterium]
MKIESKRLILMKKYLDGLKFGMLLQLAVGPMCLMVFNTAKNVGFLVSLTLVLAIALVDAFYIILASFGVSKIMDNPKIKKVFKIIGSIVLIIFGINIILNVFNINIIPGLNLEPTSSNIFIQGLILTLSNPITIVFWGSVLTTRIIEDKFSKNELTIFSVGLVSSTLIFLTFVAVLGTILSNFIPENISNIMNIIVGILIVFFGVKMIVKKEK